MTKDNELEMLCNCASALGKDSYCGPWLASVLGEVESAIRSDFLPEVSLEQTAVRCGTMLSEAQTKADEILAQAESKAKEREEAASKYVSDLVAHARRQIANADSALARF